MKMILNNQRFQMFMCFILVISLVPTISLAVGNQDEELKTKYSAILGEYEFDLIEFGGEVIILKIYIESGSLWGDSGDGYPITLEPTGDESFEFTADDPDSGALEIAFAKDDQGKYTICNIYLMFSCIRLYSNKYL